MKKISLTICCVVCLNFLSFSNHTTFNKDKNDTTVYYQSYSDKLLIKLGFTITSPSLNITNLSNKKVLKMSPLGQTSVSFGFDYKWFGLGFGLGLPQSKTEIEKKGKTSELDFQFNFYPKKIGGDAFFQHYRGFHIANPAELSQWKSDTLPQMGTMKQFAVGANAFYIFNHKRFSYAAPYVRNTKQLKSAGSLLLGAFFNMDAASCDKSFVPFDSLLLDVRDSFPIYAYSSKSYGISFGYSYTWIISKKFFMNITVMPGIGIKDMTLHTYSVDTSGVNLERQNSSKGTSERAMYKFALGYEGEKYLFGATFYGSYGNIKIENFQFQPGLGTFRFFIARRFDVSRKRVSNNNKS